MRERCGPVYICVPDVTPGPQPCPKSVKTCPVGQKRVLKPGYEPRRIPLRSAYLQGRSRKLLSKDGEDALPPWVMRERCGPVYICVPDDAASGDGDEENLADLDTPAASDTEDSDDEDSNEDLDSINNGGGELGE